MWLNDSDVGMYVYRNDQYAYFHKKVFRRRRQEVLFIHLFVFFPLNYPDLYIDS